MIELPARRVRVLSLVVAALTVGLITAGHTSAQVISGASPTFTLNTITGNTAVLSIVPDTDTVAGQATPAVAYMTSSAGGVPVLRGTATGTQTAGFRAYLRYGEGAPLDVTQTAAWDFTATPAHSTLAHLSIHQRPDPKAPRLALPLGSGSDILHANVDRLRLAYGKAEGSGGTT